MESARELETHLVLVERLGFAAPKATEPLNVQLTRVSKMLRALIDH